MARRRRFAIRNLSLRNKLVLIALAVSGLALAVALAIFVSLDLIIFRVRMSEDLTSLSRMLGSMSAAPLAFDDRQAAEEMLSSLAARSNVDRACLYNAKGDLFAFYKSGPVACAPRVPDVSGGSAFTRQNLS